MAPAVKATIAGDSRSLQKAARDGADSLRKLEIEANRSQKSLSSIDKSFQRLQAGGAALGGLTAAAFALKDVARAASDVQQSAGAVDAVFKDQAASMHEAAEAAKEIGLSQSAYGQAAAKLGAMLKNQGVAQDQVAGKTRDLIKVGADFAAMYGGTAVQAVDAISSALRGERDPIERYGITLNEAAVQAEMASGNISKAQATMNLIMRQGSDALGAAGREANTYASQQQKAAASMEDMKAKLGEGLLPVLSAFLAVGSKIANIFAAIPAPVYTITAAMIASVVAWKAYQLAILKATAALTAYAAARAKATAADAVGSVRGAAAGMLANNINKLAAAAGVLIAAYAGWDIAAGKANDSLRKQVASTDEMVEQLGKYGKSVRDVGVDLSNWGLATPLIDDQMDSLQAMQEVFNQSGWEKGKNVLGEIFSLGKGEGTVERTAAVEYLNNMKAAILQIGETDSGRARELFNELSDNMIKAGASSKDLEQLQRDLAPALAKTADAATAQSSSIGEMKTAYDEAKSAVDQLAAALLAQVDPYFAQQQATADVIATMQKLATEAGITAAAIAANGTEFNLYTEEGRTADELARKMTTDLSKLAAATQQNGGSQAEFTAKLKETRAAFVAQLTAITGNAQAAEQLADKYGLTEGTYEAIFSSNMPTAKSEADALTRALDEAAKDRQVTIEIVSKWARQVGDVWNPTLGAWVPGPNAPSTSRGAPSLSDVLGGARSGASAGVSGTVTSGGSLLGRLAAKPLVPQVTVIVDPGSGRSRTVTDQWAPNLVAVV